MTLEKCYFLHNPEDFPNGLLLETHPLGCAFDDSIVHRKYFKDKLNYNNPSYNTKCGIYSQGCGLETVTMSWRHEDYMYLVAKENGATLPQAGSFIIRKSKDRIDVKKVKPYYLSLIDKYFPAKLRW
ncbi:hypothetical protein ACFX1T_009650 [Malus domestica]